MQTLRGHIHSLFPVSFTFRVAIFVGYSLPSFSIKSEAVSSGSNVHGRNCEIWESGKKVEIWQSRDLEVSRCGGLENWRSGDLAQSEQLKSPSVFEED